MPSCCCGSSKGPHSGLKVPVTTPKLASFQLLDLAATITFQNQSSHSLKPSYSKEKFGLLELI
jgi:hypothetical protein